MRSVNDRRGGRRRGASRRDRRADRPRATARPGPAPVRARTTPSGSTTFAEPRKRRSPHGPVWFDATHVTWFSTARQTSMASKCRVCRSAATARGGRAAVDRPRGHRADDLGAVERQRPRRLGEELVVTDEHPQPADRRVERGEAVAGRVGEALGGRQVDLVVAAEDRRRRRRTARRCAARRPPRRSARRRRSCSPASAITRATSGPSTASDGGRSGAARRRPARARTRRASSRGTRRAPAPRSRASSSVASIRAQARRRRRARTARRRRRRSADGTPRTSVLRRTRLPHRRPVGRSGDDPARRSETLDRRSETGLVLF